MTTSVIVPTYNGANKIIRTLKSLANQSHLDFELIIVIDGSIDNTHEVIQNTVWNFNKLDIIQQENKGRAATRNAGVKNASGDLLLFFDDDVKLEKDVVEKHIKHHSHFQNSLLVGGILEDFYEESADIGEYKKYKNKIWLDKLPDYPKPLTKDNLYVSAANLSLPKKVFDKLGGFDSMLSDAEDYDLGRRALEMNCSIYFNNDITCAHTSFLTAEELINRWRQYAKSHKKLNLIQSNSSLFKKIIYWFLGRSFLIKTIDGRNWLTGLPKQLRYKLYDIIFTGLSVHYPHRKI